MRTALLLCLVAAAAGCGDDDYGIERPARDSGVTLTDGGAATDTAQPQAGATGAPCSADPQCAGTNPLCLANEVDATWPQGYCSAECTTNHNGKDGINPDCPGGNGTCALFGDVGGCLALCQLSKDCRTGYACFNETSGFRGCEPASFSTCDPRKTGSCAGGKSDGGVTQTCVNVGDGTVGECRPACDPFTAMGCADPMNPACHVSDLTGEGFCLPRPKTSAQAGSECDPANATACPNGYGCLNGKCWKYCNDKNAAAQCSAGAICTKLTSSTPVGTSVAGICSKSP